MSLPLTLARGNASLHIVFSEEQFLICAAPDTDRVDSSLKLSTSYGVMLY